MTPQGRLAWSALKYLCLVYLAFIILSFCLSQLLPSFDTVREIQNEKCYWIDTLLVFLECGSDVPAGGARVFIYNIWLWLIYAPMLMLTGNLPFVLWTIAFWAPLFLLAGMALKRRRLRYSK